MKIIVQSPAFLTALNTVMTNTTRMMNYIKWRALMRYGAFMGDEYLDEVLAFDQVLGPFLNTRFRLFEAQALDL